MQSDPWRRFRLGVKRGIDIVVSATLLVLLSPIAGWVAFNIRRKLGSPVLFRQERPGLHGKLFQMVKFRSMMDSTDADGNQRPDRERLTQYGRFLRRTSLDEIPELWNVLRGEMSLVGPRPLLDRYTPFFTETERKRFLVRPGITGLAQVNGRNYAPWNQRLADDVTYVENFSLLLDLRIIISTVAMVFRRENVAEDTRSVMLNLDEERAQKRDLSHD